jgi:hypothetical protein
VEVPALVNQAMTDCLRNRLLTHGDCSQNRRYSRAVEPVDTEAHLAPLPLSEFEETLHSAPKRISSTLSTT